MRRLIPAAALAALALPYAFAETDPPPSTPEPACRGTHQVTITGTVRDSTLALIPGATLTLDNHETETSGNDGRFRFVCIDAGTHHLVAAAEGFSGNGLDLKVPHAGEVQLVLQPAAVQIGVEVNADEATAPAPNSAGATATISGKELESLADDPDDLLRELQQLGAAGGGSPGNTTIAVDGFQGSTTLPPKSSIAYIKVNPDQFSAEYREPPFDGGRIEIYTKPGQPTFHGALFATNGSPWMNARDPFATSKAALGKQRYGFELNGPILKKGSDFALTLEHRSIDNFGVVNAVTLTNDGTPANLSANVATPQRLWVGQARVDWQLGARNTFITTFDAHMNSLQNVGVGGVNLAETGYNSGQYDNVWRFTDITTISPHLMHEARLALRWDGETDLPVSTAPQVQVAGAFTGGGSTLGAQRLHEFNIEADDDAILTTKNHTLKFGTQLMTYRERNQLTSNFNGSYTFGGGPAPELDANNNVVYDANGNAVMTTITGLEQYRRATYKAANGASQPLPGGTPTAFSSVSGTPTVNFTQVADALYIQDDWNVGHGVHISGGFRYFLQNDPLALAAATPRLGILWSPNKKGTWTLHAHAGMFSGRLGARNYSEILREDGVNRITSTVYNPAYGSNPLSGTAPILSARSLNPHLQTTLWAAENIGGTRSFPHGWNLSADYYIGRIWNDTRSLNINAPLNGDPNGPRALGIPNLNLLQVQNSGQGKVDAEFVGIEQHSLKRVQLFFGGVRVNLIDDTDDTETFTPQSSFSNAGEFAHRTGQPLWNVFGNASFTFPKKIVLSGNFHGGGDSHYNITTGFDNNGDGDFNDRPQYATPGAANAVQTRFGLLTASGGTGVFPRNQGVMPWQFYLDSNIQRAFTLTHNPKADHQQVLTLNVRSANLLNHTNVTAVGGVLGSPFFGVPYAADNGRRVEAGLRYSF